MPDSLSNLLNISEIELHFRSVDGSDIRCILRQWRVMLAIYVTKIQKWKQELGESGILNDILERNCLSIYVVVSKCYAHLTLTSSKA